MLEIIGFTVIVMAVVAFVITIAEAFLDRRKAKAVAQVEPQQVEPPPLRSWGARVRNLTQFGETWLDVADIQAVEFGPPDGCGCEINLRGVFELWHMPLEDAACLKAYFAVMSSVSDSMEAMHSGRVD